MTEKKDLERKSPRVTISIPENFLKLSKDYCIRRQMPFSVLVRVAMAEYMERNGGIVDENDRRSD